MVGWTRPNAVIGFGDLAARERSFNAAVRFQLDSRDLSRRAFDRESFQDSCYLEQHFLYLRPLPQGHGAFRPSFMRPTCRAY